MYQNQEVAIHGYKHLSLNELDEGMIAAEIVADRLALENALGRVIKGMAYANGAYDEKAKKVLKTCGISYARTTENVTDFSLPKDWLEWHTTCHHSNPALHEYADKFLAAKEDHSTMVLWQNKTIMRFPLLFYVWGHSYEFHIQNNWELMEGLLEKVSGQDDVWYATNGEIYQYVEDFRRLQFSANGAWVFNPSAQDIYFLANGIRICAKAGATTRVKDSE